MRLFDQNLSYKLVSLLADVFPDSAHVRDLGLINANDLALWEYARKNNLAIVSKDEDFHQFSFLYDPAESVKGIQVLVELS